MMAPHSKDRSSLATSASMGANLGSFRVPAVQNEAMVIAGRYLRLVGRETMRLAVPSGRSLKEQSRR